jgi:hypothetical protein
MIGKGGHQFGPQVHPARVGVLGLKHIDGLPFEVDVFQRDGQGLAPTHSGIEKKPQKQPELGVELVGRGKHRKGLRWFEPRHALRRFPAQRPLDTALDPGPAEHRDDRGVDLSVAFAALASG